MRLKDLKINQVPFWYQEYLGEVEQVDEDGYYTGESVKKFANPVQAYARISANGRKAGSNSSSSEAVSGPFGLDVDYDRAISTVQKLPINEFARLFIDVTPVINDDGSTNTEPDYYCVLPSHDLQQNMWAIKKIKAAARNVS